MQSKNEPTMRMQVYYYRNLWLHFWKPALMRRVWKIVDKLSDVGRALFAPVIAVWARVRQVHLPKNVDTRIALLSMLSVTLISGTTACPGCSPAYAEYYPLPETQVLRAVDWTPTLRGPDLYQPHMVYPVGNVQIASPFGWRPAPCNGCQSDHDGVDFHVPYGTEIHAAIAGTVTFIGWKGGYGYHIVIDAGYGTVTYYAHMVDGSVPDGIAEGSTVELNQVIGYVGCTGACTGAHLHFGIQESGQFVDPIPELQRYAT